MQESSNEVKFYNEEMAARIWNENAEIWEEDLRKGYDVYRNHFINDTFLKFIGDVSNKKVLYVGCGEGVISRLLSQAGAHVTAIDISDKLT